MVFIHSGEGGGGFFASLHHICKRLSQTTDNKHTQQTTNKHDKQTKNMTNKQQPRQTINKHHKQTTSNQQTPQTNNKQQTRQTTKQIITTNNTSTHNEEDGLKEKQEVPQSSLLRFHFCLF
jgi:hypothetical protein